MIGPESVERSLQVRAPAEGRSEIAFLTMYARPSPAFSRRIEHEVVRDEVAAVGLLLPQSAISDWRTPKTASESRYGSSLRKTW